MTDFEWAGRGVLVTGASGFVGGWLAQALVDRGARVIAIVRDLDPKAIEVHPSLWEHAVRVSGSVTDTTLSSRVLAEYDIEVVFHLAAQAMVQAALADPAATFDTNVAGTVAVLEACRKSSTVERVVVASSDKAYGEQPKLPYDEEESALLGMYPYDASKAAADIIARSYAATYSMAVAVTRMANIYGGGDLDPRRIVPGTIASVLAGRRPVIRSDGTPERDYMYIDDAVAGYLRVAEEVHRQEVAALAFNLGTGEPVSVLDLVSRIIKECGADLEPDIQGTATAEINRQFLSSERSRKVLGWSSQVSLSEGISRAVDWYRANNSLLRRWEGA